MAYWCWYASEVNFVVGILSICWNRSKSLTKLGTDTGRLDRRRRRTEDDVLHSSFNLSHISVQPAFIHVPPRWLWCDISIPGSCRLCCTLGWITMECFLPRRAGLPDEAFDELRRFEIVSHVDLSHRICFEYHSASSRLLLKHRTLVQACRSLLYRNQKSNWLGNHNVQTSLSFNHIAESFIYLGLLHLFAVLNSFSNFLYSSCPPPKCHFSSSIQYNQDGD